MFKQARSPFMTHDAIAALAALHAQLQARLVLMPEFRTLRSIEASLREIETLGEEFKFESPTDIAAQSLDARDNASVAVATNDPGAIARQEVNPMARALARGIENNIAPMKVHRGVAF
jgi:hypothetical protein